MNCTSVRECLADYAVGLSGDRDHAEIERHLSECVECRAEFEKQEKVMLLVEDLDALEPPVGLWNGVYNRITDAPVRHGFRERVTIGFARRKAVWSVGLASAVLAAVMVYANLGGTLQQAGMAAQEYVQGHAIYASGDILADQPALYTTTVMADRNHTPRGSAL